MSACECSLEAAQAGEQQGRATVAQLETELVGFKDSIRVAEGELAKNAPLIAHLNHSNQNMGNRVCHLGQLLPANEPSALLLCKCSRACNLSCSSIKLQIDWNVIS